MSTAAPLYSLPMSVLFQDADPAGIVYFARVFDYFHNAYAACMTERGLSLVDIIARGEWGVPLAHAEADYKGMMRFGDKLRAEIASIEFGQTSMTVHHEIVSDDSTRRVLCKGKTVHVFIDRATFRARPVPDAVRAAFSA
jgi:1,4-dihydroxy-2-naphthoyl-CoA hydrolase